VVFFFDFMSLPQIGQLLDGSRIERTKAETALFATVCPALGAMYTMYQVLVIPEVSGDLHSYFSSGWCFSEFCTAMLSQKLEQFSAEALTEYTRSAEGKRDAEDGETVLSTETLKHLSSGTLTAEGAADFSRIFEADLNNKKFHKEGHRMVVRGIVNGYLLIRLLIEAVRNQNEANIQSLLTELANKQLEMTLQTPVDESLDTLLHIAVRLPSVKIILALLRAGADPDARNLSGDTPSQFYMFPRLRAGARLCREWQGYPSDGYHGVRTITAV